MDYFKLMRPKHWVKNFLVFAAMIFSFSFDLLSVSKVVAAFIIMSLCASSIYIINDIADRNKDRKHPKKRYRPIASGKISVSTAVTLCALLFVVVFSAAVWLNIFFAIALAIYFIINIFYSFGLKNISIIDTMIVASGFVIRVVAGAYVINVPVSHWLLLCTFFLSLFMAFGKRKNEMDLLDKENSKLHRKAVSEYTDGFVNQILAITAGISVVFYTLYTIDSATIERFGTDNLIYTTPIVVFVVLRYFHLLYNKKEGGDPVAIFTKDIQIIFAVLAWIISILVIYYINA